MLCSWSSPTIDRCRIVDNEAADLRYPAGGGLYCDHSSACIVRTTIAGNTLFDSFSGANGKGGGVACDHGAPAFIDCVIEGNRNEADLGKGGGLYAEISNLTLERVTIRGNFATGGDCTSGGGIYLYGGYDADSTSYLLQGCTISGNRSKGSGGGVLARGYEGALRMENCRIENNRSESYGGGLWIGLGGRTEFQNCAIVANLAESDPGDFGIGGGIFISQSNPLLRNCTIAGNTAPEDAGGIYADRALVTAMNSIFWANEPNEISADPDDIEITWSTIDEEWPGQGNLFQDPLFRDPESGDWRLRSTECGFDEESAAIDHGYSGDEDWRIDCAFGLGGTRADQGAYGGGICEFEITVDPDPLVATPGDSISGNMEIAAWCGDTLAFDRIRAVLLGPRPVTRTIYFGPEVSLQHGESVERSFALEVPPIVPTGIERVKMILLHKGVEVASDDRYVVIRGEEPLEIRVPLDVASIAQAIALANDGDAVVVAPGTYLESEIDFDGKALTLQSENPSDPALVATTIVDGSGEGSVFVFENEEDTTSILAGLTITGGRARLGGGVRCSSSPLIEKCVIRGNWVTSHDTAPVGGVLSYLVARGGGVYSDGGSPVLRDCWIAGNGLRVEGELASGNGAGVYSYEGAPRFERCRIERNRAEAIGDCGARGGGVWCVSDSTAHFIECSITDNRIVGDGIWGAGWGYGGGIYVGRGEIELIDCDVSSNLIDSLGSSKGGGLYSWDSESRISIIGCHIDENSSSGRFWALGGGVYTLRGQLEMIDCAVSDNSAISDGRGWGGGLYASSADVTVVRSALLGNESSHEGGGAGIYYGNVALSGCTFAFNQASRGGGTYLSGDAELANSTFTANHAPEDGGGIYLFAGSPSLTSCILWGDTDTEIHEDGGQIAATHSIIEGGWPGEGNLDQDPLFRVEVDLRLQARMCGWQQDSPAIDAGAPWLKDRALGCDAGLGGDWGDIGAFGGVGALRAGTPKGTK
ncbi:MAG: hypothetical protein CME06_14240 [Gemmatimonadetes bacterium]|nr:hypothetical protein [Gemmatimonadota bacterium]